MHEKWKRKKNGKEQKLIFQKQIQFQTLNITLTLAGGSLLFGLDGQIYCKKTYWFVTASSASEIRVLSLTTKTNRLKKLIHLLNFLFFKFVVENMHHTSVFFVNSDLRGKKLLLLQQFAFRRKK